MCDQKVLVIDVLMFGCYRKDDGLLRTMNTEKVSPKELVQSRLMYECVVSI